MNKLPLLLATLIACGYDEDQFTDDYLNTTCDRYVECEADMVTSMTDMGLDEKTAQSTYDSIYTAVCETEPTETTDTGSSESECVFNGDAAKACIEDLQAASCAEFADGSAFTGANCTTVCE